MKRTNEVTEVKYWMGEWMEEIISRYLGEHEGVVGPPTKAQFDRIGGLREIYRIED